MQLQRILGVLVVIVVLFGLFMFFRSGKSPEEVEIVEDQSKKVEEVAEELSSQLGVTVPEDVERIALNDLQGEGATGLATRSYKDGSFIHTILAALPDLTAGTFYGGWLAKGKEGEEGFSVVPTGKLKQSKGGYLLEFSSSEDLRDYSQVWVSVETKDDDTPETRVLEGTF